MGTDDSNNESFSGRFGQGMRVEKNEPRDIRGRKLVREEIDNENPRGDEKRRAGGVERETVMGREIGGDFRGES